MPPLAELQRQLRDAIVGGSETSDVVPLLVGGANPAERLAIHRHHYEASLVGTLIGKFPATTWLVGSALMDEAARAFVVRHPPAAPCIAEYGGDFPGFLADRAETGGLDYICDFAELEWHLGHAAIAVDRPPIDLQALAVYGDQVADIGLVVQGGLRYLASPWPVDDLMRLHLTETAPETYVLSPADVWLYTTVPSAFLPEEDQGYVISLVQGPEGSSVNYTSDVIDEVDQVYLDIPEVEGTFSLGGFGFSGNTPNNGVIFTPFIPWGDRPRADQSAQSVLDEVWPQFGDVKEANVIAFNPPTIQGLGNVSGFVFQLQDRGNNDIQTFLQVKDELIAEANNAPELQNVFTTYTANAPQLEIDIDRNLAKALRVEVDEILNTLQSFLGSRYVNDFNAFGRSYRVYIQADSAFRSNPSDIGKLYVRSETGEMISLDTLVSVSSITGPQTLNHYNLFRSIEINGSPAQGYSSGQAIAAMERIANEILPNTMGFSWSGISLEELESGGQAPIIFGLGILFVFLVLSAQYENFIDPVIILLAVPLAMLGALLAVSMRGMPNDVYCQVGLVMLIGLASKNAILIVEFANQLRDEGLSIVQAAVEASQQRLRPIIMTAISTLLGIFPLVIATGAGSASRQSLGTAVFGGMIFSTVLSLFVVPVLYIVIVSFFYRFKDGCRELSAKADLVPESVPQKVLSGRK